MSGRAAALILDAARMNHEVGGMKSRVAECGQVVIPKALRERLGIRAGQILDFTIKGGQLIATKVASDDDPVQAVYGVLALPKGTDATMHRLRGKETPP